MIRRALSILFFITTHVLHAQQSAGSLEFFSMESGCPTSLGGWKCLELDLSSEAALDNDSTKDYAYSWSMGDGNRKPGDKIEHCYEQFGSYQVAMDLIDVETNTVIRNELSATADFYPEIKPTIRVKSEDLRPSFIEFTSQYTNADVFEPDNVYWRIDNKYYEGKSVMHPFHAAGVYQIEMGIEKDTGLTGISTACATTEVTILESDIWTAQIAGYIEGERKKSFAGPFVKNDLFCLIVPQSPGESPAIIPLNFLMSQVKLDRNGEYELRLFSGNMITAAKKFNPGGLSGNDLYGALKDSVSGFLREPIVVLESISMSNENLSEVKAAGQVEKIATFLTQNRFIRIEIGCYVHTGSRSEKGIETSLNKARRVKQSLIKLGVDGERIGIASPENNRALMNTCSALADCNWESKELNDKVEFKITGIFK
jgi:hypothetical protein